ncbi:uncharacterized protein LOC108590891 [Callithrix jacchus]
MQHGIPASGLCRGSAERDPKSDWKRSAESPEVTKNFSSAGNSWRPLIPEPLAVSFYFTWYETGQTCITSWKIYFVLLPLKLTFKCLKTLMYSIFSLEQSFKETFNLLQQE